MFTIVMSWPSKLCLSMKSTAHQYQESY